MHETTVSHPHLACTATASRVNSVSRMRAVGAVPGWDCPPLTQCAPSRRQFAHTQLMVMTTRRMNHMAMGLLCRGSIRSPAFRALVILLVGSSLFAQARADGPLPGGKSAISVEFHVQMNTKKGAKAKLNMNPMRFVMAVIPGQQTKLIIPVTNLLDAPVVINRVTVEDKSGALVLSGGPLILINLAPGEKYEVPVTLTTQSGRGKARIRITAASEKAKNEDVEDVEFSYNRTSKQVPI